MKLLLVFTIVFAISGYVLGRSANLDLENQEQEYGSFLDNIEELAEGKKKAGASVSVNVGVKGEGDTGIAGGIKDKLKRAGSSAAGKARSAKYAANRAGRHAEYGAKRAGRTAKYGAIRAGRTAGSKVNQAKNIAANCRK